MTVAIARNAEVVEAIERVTGLRPATIRAKLREAHGATKLCNLFSQWPDRADEIADWTASFALEREALDEIASITGVAARIARKRLEDAHGKTLVQNVFRGEWPGFEDSPGRTASRARPTEGEQIEPDLDQPPDLLEAPKAKFFRQYNLALARSGGPRREPAAHQAEALARLQDWYRARPAPHAGGILALPTGGGKTFSTVRFLCQEPLSDGYKVLWLAHTHHLLEQAIDAFGPLEPRPDTPIEVANIAEPRSRLDVRVVSATPGHCPISMISTSDDVLIATLQTVVGAYNRGHEKLSAFLKSADGKLIVVFDEAHHAPANSYRKLLERLRDDFPGLFLLGLTATPTYSDERRAGWLAKLFPQGILSSVSRGRLMAAGILSKPHLEDRRTNIAMEMKPGDYQRWLSSYGDLPEDIIESLAKNEERNDIIAETYLEGREKYGKTVIFADRWYQCDYLREALIKRGVRADVVYSHMDAKLQTADQRNRRTRDENHKVLHAFKQNELDVLINVRMLTEGTDVPSVKTVFLTRQTTSSILLTQMIGRALRGPKFGGTPDAYIVSFIDNWKQVISFAEFDSLPIGQADEAVAEYGKRPPLQLISIELVRRLARQMYRGSAASAAPFVTLLPVGWYRVEYQNREGVGDDMVWQRHLVMVFENEKGRYDAFIEALSEADLSVFASESLPAQEARDRLKALQEKYFPTHDEHPGNELMADLLHIARHMGQNDGEEPTFFRFEERSQHDIDAIALDCIQRDFRLRELEEALQNEYSRVDRFWRALYPNYGMFYAQYQAAQRRIMDAGRHGLDPARYSTVVSTPETLPMREPSEAIKAAVFRRDGNKCCACGSHRDLQVDHIVSFYLGGASDLDQLQTLCGVCNRNKSINELNFRITRSPLEQPPSLRTFDFGNAEDPADASDWSALVTRTVNFFYRCAAIENVEIGEGGCNITLRPGVQAEWLTPHLMNLDSHLSDLRTHAGLAALGPIRLSTLD